MTERIRLKITLEPDMLRLARAEGKSKSLVHSLHSIKGKTKKNTSRTQYDAHVLSRYHRSIQIKTNIH